MTARMTAGRAAAAAAADLRLVAASNRDLPAAIAHGQFREDL